MEINRLFRVTATFLLAFSWLFIADAKGVLTPLEQANADILKLEQDINNLVDQTETRRLLDIAHQKYDLALSAKQSMDAAQAAKESAQSAQASATIEKNNAQSDVDTKQSIRNSAYATLQNKQDALDIANINLSNTQVPSVGYQGVSFQIYPLSRSGNYAYIAPGSGLICQGGIPTFDAYAGWGAICGASQNIIGIFKATLTVPAEINDVYFAAYTDDGSRIYVDGVLEAQQWVEQGSTWGPYTRHFNTSVDKTLELEVWWYNGGGPGNMHVGWGHSGIWTGIANQYLSYGQGSSQEVIDAYNSAVSAQSAAQSEYNSALAAYNTANQNLTVANQNLTTANQNLTTANENLTTATTNLTTAESNYATAETDMIDAVQDAKDEYAKQLDFEDKQRVSAAIAQAMANQPQPTPEPTIIVDPTPEPSSEPTVEPTPEQTQPVDPTPEPTPETTPSEEPTVDPTPEPSAEPSQEPEPLPTDTPVDPTPEPTPDVPVTVDKTENTPVSNEMANLIADLTNTNTLAKLTPEQKAAVAGTLGINANEVAKVAELAKSDPTIAEALAEFGDRANSNLDAPMPYTLADATTEVQVEAFLADPLGAVFNIDPLELLSNFSELGMDMTDDQREKAQEVIIPVVLVSNIVSAVIGMRR